MGRGRVRSGIRSALGAEQIVGPGATVEAGTLQARQEVTRRKRHWRRLVQDVPDYPEPGIVFKDITPVTG